MLLPNTLPLWKAFVEKKPDTGNLANVEKLVEKAAGLLDRIIETFPTYTLHNRTHAENVIRIMGELLGKDGLEQLTDFECAVLILSAYFHDIGMVFSEKDKNNLTKEDSFAAFRKNNAEVRLKMAYEDDLPVDVAEWYCRWIHPQRVFHYLREEKFHELFKWSGSNYAKEFGLVCLSHGEDSEFVINCKEIDREYDFNHDLKFCAILLRLADILDFDHSRSPEEVYEYLGLNEPKNKGKGINQIEWRKHLASIGFVIRDKRISFRAKPTHPAIEYDVKKFLEVIENELRNCSRALRYCSDRWKNFKLPDRIDKTVINSQGYIYGEHRFALEQEDVLNLLMGENLYENPYVFVRELLQNAIDTSRHRRFYEDAVSLSDNRKQDLVIDVTHWTDNDGYNWVRVDDYGMGMDRHIIENYLLKIGKSYYNSPDFKADIFEYKQKAGKDFSPISRFGIGILSCFIVGDRVEISTKKESGKQVRLSLVELHGFFTMQIKGEHDLYEPAPMPGRRKNGFGFREKAGTSIAVRLNPTKEIESVDIERLLKKYILYPDINITFNGRLVIDNKEKLYEEEWIKNEKPQTIDLPGDEIKKIEKVLHHKFVEKPKIDVIPINLKNNSIMNELEGVIIIYDLAISDKDQSGLRDARPAFRKRVGLNIENDKLVLQAKLTKESSSFFEKDNEHSFNICKLKFPLIDEPISISHNGVVVPGDIYLTSPDSEPVDCLHSGVILLFDGLRPNIRVGRDKLKEFDWKTYSTFYFAFRKSLKKMHKLNLFDEFSEHPGKENFVFGNIKDDPLLNSTKGWKKEKIIELAGRYTNLNQIKKIIKVKGEVEINRYQIPNVHSTFSRSFFNLFRFMEILVATIIQKNLNIVFDAEKRLFLIKNGEAELDSIDFDLFPPLFFVQYINSIKLRIFNYPLNLNHNFSKWLTNNATAMSEKYPGIFFSIRRQIARVFDKKEEIIKTVNPLIDRLLGLDKSFDWDQNILLKKEDFED